MKFKLLRTKKTIWLNEARSCVFNEAKEGGVISKYCMLGFVDGEWHFFNERTVLDKPICVMFNKKRAQACKGMPDGNIIYYDRVILLWREGDKAQEQELVDETDLPWNGLIFFNTPKGEKMLKWTDSGFCSEEMSKLVLCLINMVFGKQALMQDEVFQSFQSCITATVPELKVVE